MQEKAKKLPIVTKDEFDKLCNIVFELQEKTEPPAMPVFPENAQLIQDIRKGASLTDAMAALQLSVRLESLEANINRMANMFAEIARGAQRENEEDTISMRWKFDHEEKEKPAKVIKSK